jgi:hypothetical protein
MFRRLGPIDDVLLRIDGGLLTILIALFARGRGSVSNDGLALALVAAVGGTAITIIPVERARRAAEARSHLALRRLRECAGALMRGAADFAGRVARPDDWGPGPTMNVADLARAIREKRAVWYTGREAVTVGSWATAVREASTRFAGCAQPLAPDLLLEDRELLRDAQVAADEVLTVLEGLKRTWDLIEGLRALNRPVPGLERVTAYTYAPMRTDYFENDVARGYEKLGAGLQLLHDRLDAIAVRAN